MAIMLMTKVYTSEHLVNSISQRYNFSQDLFLYLIKNQEHK